MKNYSYSGILVVTCALLCASQSAGAFFCFNFAFGSNDNDRYRRLPPIVPPLRYAPYPSPYLQGSHQFAAPVGLLPENTGFRPLPPPQGTTPAASPQP